MKIPRFCLVLFAGIFLQPRAAQPQITVAQALQQCRTIRIPSHASPVETTVAQALKTTFSPRAKIVAAQKSFLRSGEPAISVALSKTAPGTVPDPARAWMLFRLNASGNGTVVASESSLLYALFCRIRDEWQHMAAAAFESGKIVQARFRWLTGRDDFLVGRRGFVNRKHRRVQYADLERAMQELARIGCTHAVVNELAHGQARETGPAGEMYYRFYQYLPDLDQFVETKLNRGTYPGEYLDANLHSLKQQAELAGRYGLTPGMHIANPRSVPERLLRRYPFLRGARVDHTFRSYRPRYTLTLAHPAVRWHYAELMRALLRQVPNLGFVITLLNDSGSGFEYTASLYPGRNGGPYLVREWQPDSAIAAAAARNVIRYYRTLRDAAHEINPNFRIITGLKNIAEEAEIILQGMDNGIDRRMRSQRSEIKNQQAWLATKKKFEDRGSYLFSDANAKGSPVVLGVPSPWRTYADLRLKYAQGFDRLDLQVDPPFYVPRDINREVVRGFQFGLFDDFDAFVKKIAVRWVGSGHANTLVAVWKACDAAVQAVPLMPLYGGQGFTWYRFWVRPFVPDIAKVPERERAYYEQYMLSVFNNPHNIDFGADMLWQIHGQAESEQYLHTFDAKVLPHVSNAIALIDSAIQAMPSTDAAHGFFLAARDRLLAYRAYCRTLRNICAWIAGVHGYIDASSPQTREKYLKMVREMVRDELANTKALLRLWETTAVDFMPVYDDGETMHNYGSNFGELLQKKIELMQKYGNALPRIDPNYMWRMPEHVDLRLNEYIEY